MYLAEYIVGYSVRVLFRAAVSASLNLAHQGRMQKNFVTGSLKGGAEGAQRHRYRDAEGVEGVGFGEGMSPPQPTRGSG